jgi:hypothetical protein
MGHHPLDPVYEPSRTSPLERKLLNTSITDDDGKEIACLVVYFFEQEIPNIRVRDIEYKVLGSYNCSEQVVLDQIKDEITAKFSKPVIFR